MQTFLPYPDFNRSARSLDYQRLGKQRVEVLQILNALAKTTKGWQNHPCTNMWRGHEQSLIDYGQSICVEWIIRGYKDTCYDKITKFRSLFHSSKKPDWIGHNPLHLSHQSNLIRKKPEFYLKIFGNIRSDIPYIWPNS